MRDIIDQNAPQVLPDRASKNALSIEGILPLLEHRKQISFLILLTVDLFIFSVYNCKEIHIIPKLLWKVLSFVYMSMGKQN